MKNYLLILLLCLLIPTSSLLSQNKKKSVLVTVYDTYRQPFPNVTISVKNSKEKYKTDSEGYSSIIANSNDTIVFAYRGYLPSEALVADNTAIAVFMKPEPVEEEEKIVGALGIPKDKNTITYAHKEVSSQDLLIGRNDNTLEGLQAKVSGLTVQYDPSSGKAKEIYIRGRRSIKGGNAALVVIDGVISSFEILETLDNNIIESITVNKSANGAALYGSAAANGVIMVKTRKNFSNTLPNNGVSSNVNEKYYDKRPRVKIKKSTPDYIYDFKAANSIAEAFTLFNSQKAKYASHSSYYLDAYDFFSEANEKAYASQILNDVKSSEMDAPNLLRAFAYTLETTGNDEDAVTLYNKVMTLQTKNAISYRDVALMYYEMGQHQKAFNILNTLLDDTLMEEAAVYNVSQIKQTILNDVNGMIQKTPELNTDKLSGYNKINTTYDLRIVIENNRDDVNLSLKIVDPFSEICSKTNLVTGIGGELNTLYGLTEYTLRHGREGNYYILADYANYSADSALYFKVTIYKNFGTANETKEVQTIKLTDSGNDQAILKVEI